MGDWDTKLLSFYQPWDFIVARNGHIVVLCSPHNLVQMHTINYLKSVLQTAYTQIMMVFEG